MREKSLAELTEDVDEVKQAIAHLTTRIETLPYPHVAVHDEQIDRLRADVASVRTLTMWLLGLLLSAIIGSIIVLVITAGRGGP